MQSRLMLFLAFQNAGAAARPGPAQPTVKQLQAEVDALGNQLTQQHMRTARMIPGLGATGCADWTIVDPSTMGSAMVGQGCSVTNCILGTNPSRWLGNSERRVGSGRRTTDRKRRPQPAASESMAAGLLLSARLHGRT